MGGLGYAPAIAWGVTIIEYDAAWRGYAAARGIDTSKPAGMTRSRMTALLALYPDTPRNG